MATSIDEVVVVAVAGVSSAVVVAVVLLGVRLDPVDEAEDEENSWGTGTPRP